MAENARSRQSARIVLQTMGCAPEIFYERDVGLFRTRSALIGAIWQVRDNIAVDLAVRGARVNDHTAGEIRAGVTFAFGVTKGPDLLSRLFAMAQHAAR